MIGQVEGKGFMSEKVDHTSKPERKRNIGRRMGNAIKYGIVGGIEGGIVGGVIDGAWWLSDTIAHGTSELFPNDKGVLLLGIAVLGAIIAGVVGARQRE